METKEYYGGTYPTPPETEEKTIKATITETFEIETIVPKNWTSEQIREDLLCQAEMYSERKNEQIVEIDWKKVDD